MTAELSVFIFSALICLAVGFSYGAIITRLRIMDSRLKELLDSKRGKGSDFSDSVKRVIAEHKELLKRLED